MTHSLSFKQIKLDTNVYAPLLTLPQGALTPDMAQEIVAYLDKNPAQIIVNIPSTYGIAPETMDVLAASNMITMHVKKGIAPFDNPMFDMPQEYNTSLYTPQELKAFIEKAIKIEQNIPPHFSNKAKALYLYQATTQNIDFNGKLPPVSYPKNPPILYKQEFVDQDRPYNQQRRDLTRSLTSFTSTDGVCVAFASVYQELLTRQNIQSDIMYAPQHAYCTATLNGQRLNMDPTWDDDNTLNFFGGGANFSNYGQYDDHMISETIYPFVDDNQYLSKNEIKHIQYEIDTFSTKPDAFSSKNQALLWAAYLGDVDLIENLVQNGADINYSDKKGFSPLAISIYKANPKSAQKLIDLGANINYKLPDNTSMGILAIQARNDEIIDMLIEAQAVFMSNEAKIMYLPQLLRQKDIAPEMQEKIKAHCYEKDAKIIKNPLVIALQHQQHITPDLLTFDLINKADMNGVYPLDVALENKDYALASQLLKLGANIDAFDKNKNTPLLRAIKENDEKMVDFLLKNNANLTFRNHQGDTALLLATKQNQTKIALSIIDKSSLKQLSGVDKEVGNHPLHFAAYFGNNSIAQALIDKGIDVDLKNYVAQTPLLLSTMHRNEETALLLLENNANIYAKDNEKTNFLHYATIGASPQLIDIALDNNIDINSKNMYEQSALSFAIKPQGKKTLTYLLDKGADVNILGFNNDNLLITAMMWENIEAMQLLLDNGININQQNDMKETPLMYATYNEKHQSLQFLLDNGADTSIKNELFQDVKDIAIMCENNRALNALKQQKPSTLLHNLQQNQTLLPDITHTDFTIDKTH